MVLHEGGDPRAPLLDRQLWQRPAVPAHGAGVRVVQAARQLDEGGLAGTVGADQGDRLSVRDAEAHAAHRVFLCAGVAKGDVLEHQAVGGLRTDDGRPVAQAVVHVQHVLDRPYTQPLCLDLDETVQEVHQAAAQIEDRSDVERQIAGGQGPLQPLLDDEQERSADAGR